MLQQALKYLLVLLFTLQAGLQLSGQTDTARKNSMSFDLGITRGQNLNLWPILKRYRNNEKKELQVLFPLFANRYSYVNQSRHLRLLPFYVSDSSMAGTNRRYLSLYYPSLLRVQNHRDSAGAYRSFHFLELAPHVSLLGISRSANGLSLEENLLFFVWFKKEVLQQRTSLVVFPAYWYFANGNNRTQLLLPVYFYRKQGDSSYLNAGLLYNRWHSPAESRQVFFPLWCQKTTRSAKDTVRRSLVAPLYWHRESRHENSTVLFPLIYSYRHGQQRSFTFFPLYSQGRKDSLSSYIAITPLFWHTHSKEGTRNVLFPLLWNKTTYTATDTIQRNFLFPLFWQRKGHHENSAVFFPLVYSYRHGQQRSFTFFPLYAQGRKDSLSSYMAITPLFWYTHSKEGTRNILFPLLWNKTTYTAKDTTKMNVVFPLFWHYKSRYENTNILFPLVYSYRYKQERSLAVIPLFSWGRRDSLHNHLALTPLFWHIRSKGCTRNILFPLFWNKTTYLHDDTIRKNVFFPLYWETKSEHRNNRVLFPILFDLNYRQWHSLTVFPLFSTGGNSSLNNSYFAITPFFWHRQTPEHLQNVLFPVYWHSLRYTLTDTIRKEVLFPLLWRSQSKLHEHIVVFPLLFHFKNPGRESLTVFPFFNRSNDSLRSESRLITPLYWDINTPKYRKQVLFPIYWDTEEYLAKDTILRKMIFPILWSTHTRSVHNTVFFPLFYQLQDSSYQSLTLFPFFSKGQSADDSSRHLAITPLFWRVQQPRSATTLLLPFYWNHYQLNQRGDTLRSKGIFPVFWNSSSPWKNNYMVLPFVYSVNNETRRSLTVFPFFSYGRRKDSTGSHLAITPLFWRVQRNTSQSTLLFPIYFHKKTYLPNDTMYRTTVFPLVWSKRSSQSRSFVFLPLVFNHKDRFEKSFTLLPLFSYGQRYDSTQAKRLAVTPLFWHFSNRYGSRDVLFPLYWSKTVHLPHYELKRRVLFPVYWRKKDNLENNTVLFPLVYSFRRGPHHSFTIFPLFSYGKDTAQQSDHLVLPLFWHTHKKHETWNVLFPVYWNHSLRSSQDTVVKHVFFPLFWHSHSRQHSREVLFPVYWHKKSPDASSTVFFPLIYSNRYKGYSSFTFFPLFSCGRDTTLHSSYLMATPLFWHYSSKQGKRNILFPLFWQRKGLNGDQRLVLFPLYWHVRQGSVKKDIFLPLVYRFSNAHYKSFTVFPLMTFGQSHDGRQSHLLVTPLFGRFRHGDTTHTFLFPLFDREHSAKQTSDKVLLFVYRHMHHANGSSRTSLLWPLCQWVRDSSQGRRFHIAPLAWGHRNDSSRLLSVQPFFYSRKTNKKSTFILSAFLYKRTQEFGVSVSNSFLFRTYYHKHYNNGDFENRFLHLFIANVNVNGRREKSFLPLFHTITEKNGDRSVSYLLGIYNRFSEYKPEIKDVYEEERIFWVIRLRSNYKQLKSEGKGDFTRRKRSRRSSES